MTIPYPPLDQPSGWTCPTCGAVWSPTFTGPCTHPPFAPQTKGAVSMQDLLDLLEEHDKGHTCSPVPGHRPGATTGNGWSCQECGRWHPDYYAS